MAAFYFFSQFGGKESRWDMSPASQREAALAKGPAFSTVLDLTAPPLDNDWSKVRYKGPFYADFDAADDIELVCEQFRSFLGKLATEYEFDVTQARLYATGGKGFHIEIPPGCIWKTPAEAGYPWLPYVYREMAQNLIVDTLDLAVYTGKRGRQWRTPNVKRDNGNYKVALTLAEAMEMTPELYAQIISQPRDPVLPNPPTQCSRLSALFDQCQDKVLKSMRGKKKRQESANAILDPWKALKQIPPSIQKIMSGEDLRDGVGFQAIALQLSIYAVTMAMTLPEFLAACKGLIEHHVSDSSRYNTDAKRRGELSRMWDYMSDSNLYDFEVGPVIRLLKDGTPVPDLGVMDKEDHGDLPTKSPLITHDEEDGDVPAEAPSVVSLDPHKRLRRGFFMNATGMFRQQGSSSGEIVVDPICRATLRHSTAYFGVESKEFQGYEFDILVSGKTIASKQMLSAEAFTSSASIRKFLVAHQTSFQGLDTDVAALLDIMSEKAERNGRVYTYPREGFFVVNNPEVDTPTPVMMYLTKSRCISSLDEEHPDYFVLKYKPSQAISSYDIDIDCAPSLEVWMEGAIADLLAYNRPTVVADTLGWFIAAHYRSLYLKMCNQFPLLQVYGEAGSGKSQTVHMLSHLHWFMPEKISIKSASSFTNYSMDSHASSSTSAPFIIDEYKPREIRAHRGKLEKLKDVLKASYMGTDIGERGTINRGAENSMAIVKSKCTAPIVFMGEAIEMETAIIERSVCVPFSKAHHSDARSLAFKRLQTNPVAISALGRAIINAGFRVNLETMKAQMDEIEKSYKAKLPPIEDKEATRPAERMIFNRCVITHALRVTLKHVLGEVFGDRFDADIEALVTAKSDSDSEDTRALRVHSMSEVSKTLNRISLMSRDVDLPHEMRMAKDYWVGEGWVEIRMERAYDQYRRYCASIHDVPLFDSMDAFFHAMGHYSPVIDRVCPSSELREEGSPENIFRFDVALLKKMGVGSFR